MGTIGSSKSATGWFEGLSDAPKSSMPPSRFGPLARSSTIWVKIAPSPEHGELFSEMVLWPTPNGGSGLQWHKNAHQRWTSDHRRTLHTGLSDRTLHTGLSKQDSPNRTLQNASVWRVLQHGGYPLQRNPCTIASATLHLQHTPFSTASATSSCLLYTSPSPRD